MRILTQESQTGKPAADIVPAEAQPPCSTVTVPRRACDPCPARADPVHVDAVGRCEARRDVASPSGSRRRVSGAGTGRATRDVTAPLAYLSLNLVVTHNSARFGVRSSTTARSPGS